MGIKISDEEMNSVRETLVARVVLTDDMIEKEAEDFANSSFAERRTKKDAYARGMRSARAFLTARLLV